MLCFTSREDVPLRRSPLREVICQVRFPPQLRIVEGAPAAFQEHIRARFPELDTLQGVRLLAKPLAEEPLAAKAESPIFRFLAHDGDLLASLGMNFYALSTTAYTHWPDFLGHLLFLSKAARDVYELPHATRVGLRYINHITPQNTGTTSVSDLWDILRPELTVLLRGECWDNPEKMGTQLSLTGEENEKLTLRTAFINEESPNLLLDFDYYSEGQIDLDGLSDIYNRYHDIIYSAFRWCIPDDRLAVFDPVLVEED